GVLEEKGRIRAALACPIDPPEIAWIRIFAVGAQISPRTAWQKLWRFALEQFSAYFGPIIVGAIVLNRWFEHLLVESGFEQRNEIVVLIWRVTEPKPDRKMPSLKVRQMTRKDLPQVEQVDHLAFSPPWRISSKGLLAGYEQAAIATVAEHPEGFVIGYQMSTVMNDSAHLARLAVLPAYQNCGVGTALVHALQTYCFRIGLRSLTVNTQGDNLVSLHLYSKLDFHPTGEKYPLFLFERRN
ncbi:MAG: GNAT family N-acetyltransferase, partial [Anaerolineales bacterium]|nr:GNAT family N-acetyltransferase [Anaerolineales bacterium]MDW8446060.1 GNAT family N-acetyltransferase [Anaerolineales bacterium]